MTYTLTISGGIEDEFAMTTPVGTTRLKDTVKRYSARVNDESEKGESVSGCQYLCPFVYRHSLVGIVMIDISSQGRWGQFAPIQRASSLFNLNRTHENLIPELDPGTTLRKCESAQ